MNPFAAKLGDENRLLLSESPNQLSVYYDYLRGSLSREELLSNIPKQYVKAVLCETMSDDTLPGLFKTIDSLLEEKGLTSVDVIIGGPPCQAYSLVGRAQSSHMETPMEDDPRNGLYKLYARFLKKYQPRMFVFENVIGIESANNGKTWKNIQKYLRVGYEIECHEQNSKDWGSSEQVTYDHCRMAKE